MLSVAECATLSFVAILTWAAASDVFTRRITNETSIVIALTFVIYALSTGMPASKIALHFGCGLFTLACGFSLYARNVIGGGDAKLFSATSLWFGFGQLAPFFALTTLAGGILALTYLARAIVYAKLSAEAQEPNTIPYGAAIAAGALLVLPRYAS